MGKRGIGAKALSERGKLEERAVKPWERKRLSRPGRVIAFLEDLPITSGKFAGSKMKLRPWQRKFIKAVYRQDRTGLRPVRTAVLSIARKNGKTQLAAGLGLCHLLGPESEPRGEVYSAALTKDQAARLFSEMVAILRKHPELDDRCNVIQFSKRIEVLRGAGDGSIYEALAADADSQLGKSPSFVVYDELGSAPNRKLFDALDTATGARENPLIVAISTQAAADHHIFSELVDYGKSVNAGDIDDPSFHLTIYEAPADADPWDPKTWKMANPAIGDFRSLADVERQASQAKMVPSKENAFRNLILNQRVSAVSRFINMAEWAACSADVELESLLGRPCFGGLDLSRARDLTAFVLVFPDDAGGFDVVAQHFMPADNIEDRAHEDRVPYDLWARQGFITLIPGKVIDPGFIADAIAEASVKYDLKRLGYDRWRVEDLKRELGLIGVSLPLVPHGQGFREMGPAVDKLERHVACQDIRHGNDPVLKMCAANAVVTRDGAGNRKLDKDKTAGRIDGLVALAMALSVAHEDEPEPQPGWVSAWLRDQEAAAS